MFMFEPENLLTLKTMFQGARERREKESRGPVKNSKRIAMFEGLQYRALFPPAHCMHVTSSWNVKQASQKRVLMSLMFSTR